MKQLVYVVAVAKGMSVEGRQLQFQCQPISVLELPLGPYVGSHLNCLLQSGPSILLCVIIVQCLTYCFLS